MRLNPHYPFYFVYHLGRSHQLMQQYEEAISAMKKALARNPDFSPAHFQLAVIYSELGRTDEARAEVAEILRINPRASVEGWRQRQPYKDQALLERNADALRKAGLPEKPRATAR